jgi:hypothetical protein
VVESVSPVPIAVSLLVGDCVGNFRASLDHMWTAVLDQQGVEPASVSNFPILRDRSAWRRSRSTTRIQSSSIRMQLETAVEEFQPYRDPRARQPLLQLRELVARDEHRLVSLMVCSRGATLTEGESSFVGPPQARLEPGAVLVELGRQEILSLGWQGRLVAARFDPMPRVAFAEPTAIAGLEVLSTLTAIRDEVARVMAGLAKFYAPEVPYDEWMRRPN